MFRRAWLGARIVVGWLAVGWELGGVALAGAASVSSLNVPAYEARGLRFPIREPGTPDSLGEVRIEHLFLDRQRRGFYRIGVLPLIAAEHVRIECRDPARLPTAFQAIRRALPEARRQHPVELRDFTLQITGEPLWRLRAARARLSPSGEVVLDGGVQWIEAPQRTNTATRATLPVTGPDAGWLLVNVHTNVLRTPLATSLTTPLNTFSAPTR